MHSFSCVFISIFWLVVYFIFVWFSAFWLRYLCLWFTYGFLGPMLRPLAGVLLKLGDYGLLHVFPVLFKFGFMFGVV